MIIDFVIPEQCLITISPEKVLCPDILVRELDFLLGKRTMDRVIVMLGVQFISVE